MTTTETPANVHALLLDLCEWLAPAPRRYDEVMDAWRTSCPRLDVWETAQDLGYVERRNDGGAPMVLLTPAGKAALHASRRTGGAL